MAEPGLDVRTHFRYIGGRIGLVDSAPRERKAKRAQWLRFSQTEGDTHIDLHSFDATSKKSGGKERN